MSDLAKMVNALADVKKSAPRAIWEISEHGEMVIYTGLFTNEPELDRARRLFAPVED